MSIVVRDRASFVRKGLLFLLTRWPAYVIIELAGLVLRNVVAAWRGGLVGSIAVSYPARVREVLNAGVVGKLLVLHF